jgi:hypothetical protein
MRSGKLVSDVKAADWIHRARNDESATGLSVTIGLPHRATTIHNPIHRFALGKSNQLENQFNFTTPSSRRYMKTEARSLLASVTTVLASLPW